MILMSALMLVGTSACSQVFSNRRIKASKNYVTKEMRLDDFSKMSVAGSFDVCFTQQPGRPEVAVTTSDNLIEHLNIRVKDHTLCISWKEGINVSQVSKLEVRVSAEQMNAIAVAGSADVELMNSLNAEDLKLSVAGSGDVKGGNISCNTLAASVAGSGSLEIDGTLSCSSVQLSVAGSGNMELEALHAEKVEASVAGSGTLELAGTATRAEYSVAGSGDILAASLQCKDVSASVTGSGDVECHATGHLKARTAGSGSIAYKGNPEVDYPKKGLRRL